MSTTEYKGFSIVSRPYLLRETQRWTTDLVIRCQGRSQPIALGGWYVSQLEAEAHSAAVARLLIDRGLPKWSAEGPRRTTRDRWAARARPRARRSRGFFHQWKDGLMRPSLIAGIVLVVLGIVVLVRGGSFTTEENVLSIGDLEVSAEERQTIPPWAGGAALAAGVALIAFGGRKRP